MAVFAIGDLHLSLGCEKPMDIFPGWQGYLDKIINNWNGTVCNDDTVVIAGDVSWGMSLEESLKDFKLLESLPGKKVIIKGNHDYWWNSRKKMESFFSENGLNSLNILHNNCIALEDFALCGTRGWIFEEGAEHDKKVVAREEGRLRASLEGAVKLNKQPVVFLHYPPIFGEETSPGILELLIKFNVKKCYYGHLHGPSCHKAFQGEYLGVDFSLISADHMAFNLKKIVL